MWFRSLRRQVDEFLSRRLRSRRLGGGVLPLPVDAKTLGLETSADLNYTLARADHQL
jgi:hypothetical protein